MFYVQMEMTVKYSVPIVKTFLNAILTSFQASTFCLVEFSWDITSECRFHNEIFVQGEKNTLRAIVRYVGAKFTCAVATHNNSFLFNDDMSSSNVALPHLDNIYNRDSIGWFSGGYIKAATLSVLSISTENVRIPHESKFNRTKLEVKNFPLWSKLRKIANDKYYKKNKKSFKSSKRDVMKQTKKRFRSTIGNTIRKAKES